MSSLPVSPPGNPVMYIKYLNTNAHRLKQTVLQGPCKAVSAFQTSIIPQPSTESTFYFATKSTQIYTQQNSKNHETISIFVMMH